MPDIVCAHTRSNECSNTVLTHLKEKKRIKFGHKTCFGRWNVQVVWKQWSIRLTWRRKTGSFTKNALNITESSSPLRIGRHIELCRANEHVTATVLNRQGPNERVLTSERGGVHYSIHGTVSLSSVSRKCHNIPVLTWIVILTVIIDIVLIRSIFLCMYLVDTSTL